MKFHVKFLGVGGALTPELGNNNILIESEATSSSILLDCGFTAPLKLGELDRLADVEHILLSHAHSDHIGGLETIAYLYRYKYGRKPNLYFHSSLWDEIWNGSLRGGLEASQDESGQACLSTLSDFFQVHLFEGDSPVVEIPGFPLITMRQTLHVLGKPSYCFYLGSHVYFSADSQLTPPTHGPNGEDLHAIFQDCQLTSGFSNVHSPLDQLVAEMTADQKRIAYLMHYSLGFERIDAPDLGFIEWAQTLKKYEFED